MRWNQTYHIPFHLLRCTSVVLHRKNTMQQTFLDDDADESCATDDRTVSVSNVNPERVKNSHKPVTAVSISVSLGEIKYSYSLARVWMDCLALLSLVRFDCLAFLSLVQSKGRSDHTCSSHLDVFCLCSHS